MRKNKKNSPIGTVLLVVLLFVLVAIAAVSGIKLYRYYADYAKDRDHYEDLRDEVVKEQTEAEQATLEEESDETEEENSTPKYRKKLRKRTKRASTAPLSIDWEELKAINKDIIGWVYFTGLPQISYPILQAQDNAYYVHRTFDLSDDSSKAGSIFMDYRMAGDFSSPYSVIYGHNVRDGSMLSDLAQLTDQELYDEEPYFWILTPDGNYRYQIFSIFQCHRSADVFQEDFDTWGIAFNDWQENLKARNVMKGDVALSENGHVIAFSTCVPNSFDRTIVCGTYIGGDTLPDPHPDTEAVTQP